MWPPGNAFHDKRIATFSLSTASYNLHQARCQYDCNHQQNKNNIFFASSQDFSPRRASRRYFISSPAIQRARTTRNEYYRGYITDRIAYDDAYNIARLAHNHVQQQKPVDTNSPAWIEANQLYRNFIELWLYYNAAYPTSLSDSDTDSDDTQPDSNMDSGAMQPDSNMDSGAMQPDSDMDSGAKSYNDNDSTSTDLMSGDAYSQRPASSPSDTPDNLNRSDDSTATSDFTPSSSDSTTQEFA
jgi:hypothetical protein